jgi:hypothetical protein
MSNTLDIGTHEGEWVPPEDDNAPTPGPLDDIKSGIKAWFDIGLSIGNSVDDVTRSIAKLNERLQRNTPVDYGNATSVVVGASGIATLVLGTPDQGTRWEVTGCIVGGTDLNVIAAGTAGLYVSAVVPLQGNQAAGGLSSAADYAVALPRVAFYGTRQLVVNDQEYLFLVLFGATPGQTYIANMSATVFNLASAGGKTEISQ